jgi:hypothetical protein
VNDNLLIELNKIYKPLCDKFNELKSQLTNLGFEITSGFYNNHYVKRNNEYVVEYFPIPIICITNIGDIGLDTDSIWVEIKQPKEMAISLDYPQLAYIYKMEVYGSENFLVDIYNKLDDPYETSEKIKQSDESIICIAFTFKTDIDLNEIIKLIQIFVK